MTYSFTCDKCKGVTYEEIPAKECTYQTIVSCKYCEGIARRKIEAAPVHFTGSGFYVTESGVNPASK